MESNTVTKDETSASKMGIESGPAPTKDHNGPDVKLQHPRLSRKRTKTGCLTCRRRRIKCGEERPTCGNCVKSKRHCQGYNQRVIFKDPLNTFRVSASVTTPILSFQREPTTGVPPTSRGGQIQNSKISPIGPLSTIAPKLNPYPPENVPTAPTLLHAFPSQVDQVADPYLYSTYRFPGGGASKELNRSSRNGSSSRDVLVDDLGSSDPIKHRGSSNHHVLSMPETLYNYNSSHDYASKPQTIRFDADPHTDWSGNPDRASELSLHELVYKPNIRNAASTSLTQSHQGGGNWPLSLAHGDASHPRCVFYSETPTFPITGGRQALYSERLARGPHLDEAQEEKNYHDALDHCKTEPLGLDERVQHVPASIEREEQMMAPVGDVGQNCEGPKSQKLRMSIPSSGELLLDMFDEDMNAEEQDRDLDATFAEYEQDHLRNNDLGIFVALQATRDQQGQALRTYHSFIGRYAPDMLTTYQPSAQSSPLNDSVTARIFYHFINVIAPSISMYERHPANPSLLFQGRPVHISQQHIWAYTMPTFALGNQALLHAMLALGSLHIARVQDSPITVSLKHYHIALRRIAKNVGLPTCRGQPATLAATMLLGWYEVMSSDHQKWSNHVLGAKQLLKEIDFAGMTRYFKIMKSQRRAWHGNLYHHNTALGIANEHYPRQAEGLQLMGSEDDLNENLVNMIMGRKFCYNQYGKVLEDINITNDQQRVYTQRDLEIYETQKDLFWWYCKQDMFQSVLSGSRLFMPYDLWSHCPPRASIGRLDAIYGTFDHVILLLGRLADFTARDLKRKRKVMQANGGQWRPLSGASDRSNITAQAGPSQSQPPHVSFERTPPQMPLFAGMIPGTEGKATLPRGFSPVREEPPMTLDCEDYSTEDQTAEADEEWHEIRSAFSVLVDSFGPDFQALGPECSQPVQTPFGPALQYRTYGIGGIWISYYMGIILCHRAHPSMPPAAMAAAGVAARETAYFANEIGRIAAGIAPNSSVMAQVHTGVGAGLIESCFGLFVAGVQYQDPLQRAWLVQKCQDIARLTGWHTAQTIGTACETSWIKAAEAGRGSLYTKATENGHSNPDRPLRGRRVDHILSERACDNAKLKVTRTDLVHYALGLLGVEEDFKNIDFECDGLA